MQAVKHVQITDMLLKLLRYTHMTTVFILINVSKLMNEFGKVCGKLDSPINSRNWISCVKLDLALQ